MFVWGESIKDAVQEQRTVLGIMEMRCIADLSTLLFLEQREHEHLPALLLLVEDLKLEAGA